MDEIIRMQKNLLLIRRTVGWTAEEFGEKIGVTRQTINNIESGRNKLTKTQYIAMRSVLDAEITQYPEETEMLRSILDIVVDNPEKYNKNDRELMLMKANMISPSILSGTSSRKEVSKEWITMVGTLIGGATLLPLGIGVIAPIIAGSWLTKVIQTNSKRKGK